MRWWLPILGLSACAAEPEPYIPPVETPFWTDSEVGITLETSAAAGTDLAWLSGGRSLALVGGELLLQDPRNEAPIPLMSRQSELRGGAWLAERSVLVGTDAGLTYWDGELRESPLAERITGEVAELRDAGSARWILDDAGWHYTTDEVWSTPQVDDGPASEGLVILDASRAWLQRGDTLALLARTTDGWSLEEHWEIPDLRDFAVDEEGTVWATDGLDLHRRVAALEWSAEVLPASVAQLEAHPGAPGVWVQTTDGTYHGDSNGVAPVSVPDGWWLGADPAGGLLIRTDTDLVTARVVPGLELLDIPSGSVDGVSDIVLTAIVRPPDGLDSIGLSVGGQPVEISQTLPFRAVIDTTGLARGENALELTARWQDGRTQRIERSLRSDAGVVTWRQHIQPIFQDRCQVCHGGSADTVLETSPDWQDNLALILEQVEQARMPLGDDPLPDDEIDLIRAWRDGGFP